MMMEMEMKMMMVRTTNKFKENETEICRCRVMLFIGIKKQALNGLNPWFRKRRNKFCVCVYKNMLYIRYNLLFQAENHN